MRQLVVPLIALLGACNTKSAEPSTADAAEVFHVMASDVSPPLRELAKLPQFSSMTGRQAEELEMEPVRRIPHPSWANARAVADPVVQSTLPPLAVAPPIVSFDGMGAGIAGFTPGGVPPDTDGDIGDTQYVEVVNTSIAVVSRTGTLVMNPARTSVVWSGFVGACANTNDGDATVRYDHIAKRWVIAQFSLGPGAGGPYFQCVAVSKTSDATGQYSRYQFGLNALNDYPKMGLWPDGYYFTFNMFAGVTGGFQGGKICAMDRVKMVAGDATATMQCFDSGINFGGLLASDMDGKTPPPANAPNYVVALDSNTTLAYWKLHVDYATPANSKFTGPTSVTVASYNPVCGGGTCITQPGSAQQLDSLADRAMNRLVYRRFADREALVFSHSVTAGTGGGVRWYELRTPETPTVFQQGTFAPTAAFRWIPSIAMDGSGNIATIYAVSSTTVNPSVRYAARIPTDAPGTFGQGEGILVAGAGAQAGLSRFGDYASLNIDPVDDCTFWGAQEYRGATTNAGAWRTRIGSFIVAGCSAFSAATDNAETVAQGGTAMYTVTTTTTAGTPQQVALSATGLPAGVTATFNPPTVTSGATSQITLTADTTAAVGMTNYNVVAAGNTSQMINVALTVTAAPQPPDAGPGGGDDTPGDDGGTGSGCCSTSPQAPIGSLLLGLGVVLALRRRRR